MAHPNDGDQPPTRLRLFMETLIVILIVLTVWKVIDYRSQPPPPPATSETTGGR